VWSLDRSAVTRWQEGENIQNAFPDMSAADREILISGTHAACWDKLFPGEEGDDE
jgi:transcriptional regulator GlxA family with amidase domain